MRFSVSRFARNGFMASMGAIIAVGLGLSFLHGGGSGGAVGAIKRELGLGASGQPVLVIFVDSARAVAVVRAAVEDERIVAETPQGFALREGRIIAANRDAAGEVVSAAGWVDRELQLMRVRKNKDLLQPPSAKKGRGSLVDEDLARLAGQETLTRSEAYYVLEHI